MDRELSLKEALEYIDPSSLDYQEWVGIGMGLKEAGYTSEDWDRWSSGDPKRYHPGISIHAPLAGRDPASSSPTSRPCLFQSTRPLRGAT